MQISKIRLVPFILACIPLFCLAQQNTISPYSAYGIGDLQSQGLALNNSLGGLGVALSPNNTLNPMNPASLSALTMTAFETGVVGTAFSLSDNIQTQEYFSSALAYLSLGFPIAKGLGISVGLLPYTFQGYETSQNFVVEEVGGYSINHSGFGGLNKAYANLGMKVHKNLSVGASVAMIFGSLGQKRDLSFDNTDFLNRRDISTLYIRDYVFDFGAQFKKFINEKKLVLGATLSPQAALKGTEDSFIHTYDVLGSIEYTRDTFNIFYNSSAELTLPTSYILGVAYEKENHWLISGEYDFKEWSQLSFFNSTNTNQRNKSEVRLGGWWIPKAQDIHNYWNTIQYRAGISYSTGFLSISTFEEGAGMTDITDINFSFGLGLPMRRTKTTANIGVQMGRRGTKENNLVKEEYIKLLATFTFNDKWFTKRKIE